MKALMIESNLGDVYIITDQVKIAFSDEVNIDIAFSLSSGLNFLDKNKYDFILLSLNLKDSSGIDTLSTLLTKTARIPVIIIDDYYNETNRMLSISLGAEDYIVKNSLDSISLVSVVKNSIDRMKIKLKLINKREYIFIEQIFESG